MCMTKCKNRYRSRRKLFHMNYWKHSRRYDDNDNGLLQCIDQGIQTVCLVDQSVKNASAEWCVRLLKPSWKNTKYTQAIFATSKHVTLTQYVRSMQIDSFKWKKKNIYQFIHLFSYRNWFPKWMPMIIPSDFTFICCEKI